MALLNNNGGSLPLGHRAPSETCFAGDISDLVLFVFYRLNIGKDSFYTDVHGAFAVTVSSLWTILQY